VQLECSIDADCEAGGGEYICNSASRCEDPFLSCVDNDDCIPLTSDWTFPCESDSDCIEPDESCIEVFGSGRCALDDDPYPCEDSEPTPWPTFPAGGMVDVCEDRSGRCDNGTCRDSCVLAGCVSSSRGKVCNTTTGLCGCNTATPDCAGIVGRPLCNTTTHLCECGSDNDCGPVAGADICVNGRCGCSGTAACNDEPNPHDNAEPVCD
jgi:hypothetical protein